MSPVPPRAEPRAHSLASPHGARDDPWYWLRDDTRQDPQVLAYLAAENAYREAVLEPLAACRAGLYRELLARVRAADESVPVYRRGYWYQVRYVAQGEYPVYLRRRAAPDPPHDPCGAQEILLDGNARSEGHAQFHIGNLEVSPDGTRLAWAEDTVGRREYVLKFRDLLRAVDLPGQIAGAESDLAWGDDSCTLCYVAKDPHTLLGSRVMRHALGGDGKDVLVHHEQDTSFYTSVFRSRSERYLYIASLSTLSSEYR